MYVYRRPRSGGAYRFSIRFNRKTKIKIISLAIIALILFCITMSMGYLRRASTEMAISDAIDAVTIDINSSVNDRMASENMSYDRFVSLETNESGGIVAIKTNMSEINALSSNLLSDVVGKGDRRIVELEIPLGNLLGSSFLMGKGPDVPLSIIMLTSSRIEFRNDLVSAGINQTKHRIIFEIIVDIDILIPWDIETTTVRSEILIAETVIVGSVPDTYISLE